MTDINEVFPQVEETEPAPVEEPSAVEAEATEPEPAPEPSWYEKAGFESEADALKKIENLKKWETDLNRKSSELGAQKTQPAPEPVAAPADTDDPYAGLDPSSAATLKKITEYEARRIAAEMVAQVAPGAELGVAQFNRAAQKEFETFAQSNDVDGSELSEVMDTHNLWPDKPDLELLNEQMKVAAAFIKQSKFDPEAEREKLREEILKELKDEGASVKAVEPNKPVVKEPEPDELNKSMGLFGLLNLQREGKI